MKLYKYSSWYALSQIKYKEIPWRWGKVSFKINSDIEQTILIEQLGDRLLMSELILKLTLMFTYFINLIIQHY